MSDNRRFGKGAETGSSTPAPRAPALQVSQLSYEVKLRNGTTRLILGDVDLKIDDTEFVSVLGASGCGKTTLLNIAAGFVRPSRGTVTCHGTPVRAPGWERGVVFQKPALFPWMSVLENVLFGPRARGERRAAAVEAKARALLRDVGLSGYEGHRIYELSGGMQHRVAIVRILVNEPALLLMDEPFAALDAQTRSDMQELLLGVWEKWQSTVMFVTHDIEEALLLSDRVVVMAPGRIQEVLDVDIPRPRKAEDVLNERMLEMRGEIRAMLRKELPIQS